MDVRRDGLDVCPHTRHDGDYCRICLIRIARQRVQDLMFQDSGTESGLCCSARRCCSSHLQELDDRYHRSKRARCGGAPPRLFESLPLEQPCHGPTKLHETTSVMDPSGSQSTVSGHFARPLLGASQLMSVFAAAMRPSSCKACVRWTKTKLDRHS